ncbi:hypothetical protein KKA14_01410 [bacterium]|nr:hypothetical protein [bacterium]
MSITLILSPTAYALDEVITPEVSRMIINRIKNKAALVFKKYRGIESEQEINSQIFDSETGALRETERVVYIIKEYYYEKPEIIVLEYERNGKKVPLSEYKKRDDDPGYQIFDTEGEKRFEIKIIGHKVIEGQLCYQIKVTPKEMTVRHFNGYVFVRVDNLNVVFSEGSIAKHPMGLKKMDMKLYFEPIGEVSALRSSDISLLIHVPFIKPNTRIDINTKVLKKIPILNN